MPGVNTHLKLVAQVLLITSAAITCCYHIQLLIIYTMRSTETFKTEKLASVLTQIFIIQ